MLEDKMDLTASSPNPDQRNLPDLLKECVTVRSRRAEEVGRKLRSIADSFHSNSRAIKMNAKVESTEQWSKKIAKTFLNSVALSIQWINWR